MKLKTNLVDTGIESQHLPEKHEELAEAERRDNHLRNLNLLCWRLLDEGGHDEDEICLFIFHHRKPVICHRRIFFQPVSMAIASFVATAGIIFFSILSSSSPFPRRSSTMGSPPPCSCH
ncbi:hypothetical protein FCV25MIE_03679 [Fagus crenata]